MADLENLLDNGPSVSELSDLLAYQREEIQRLENVIRYYKNLAGPGNAAGPWQTNEPLDGGTGSVLHPNEGTQLYLFKQVKRNYGAVFYHVGWRWDDKTWNSMGLGPISTARIVGWAPLNKPEEDSDERR